MSIHISLDIKFLKTKAHTELLYLFKKKKENEDSLIIKARQKIHSRSLLASQFFIRRNHFKMALVGSNFTTLISSVGPSNQGRLVTKI